MATIHPKEDFDASGDALALRKAMKGLGCDAKSIIEIICARSNEQRQQIVKQYQLSLGRNLIDDLKSELSGNLEKAILSLMKPTTEYVASEVKAAIKGLGTDEAALIEILCTRNNSELDEIKNQYKQSFGLDMVKDVADDLSGSLKQIMVALMTAARPIDAEIDIEKVKKDAEELRTAGIARRGTDIDAFLKIFCSNSFSHLASVFDEYKTLTKEDIKVSIKKELSGDLQKSFLAIVKAIQDRPLFFAECLYKSMDGLVTDNKTIIRVLVSRCEIDLKYISDAYDKQYGKPLETAVASACSGDYGNCLYKILTGHSKAK